MNKEKVFYIFFGLGGITGLGCGGGAFLNGTAGGPDPVDAPRVGGSGIVGGGGAEEGAD